VTPGEDFFGMALAAKFLAHSNTRENNGNDGVPTLPHSSWTAAIQSGCRDARRN
jgi:hypothetical protein